MNKYGQQLFVYQLGTLRFIEKTVTFFVCQSINAEIYNTKDYGIPQNRERIYIIGIRKDAAIKAFIKPKKSRLTSISKYISRVPVPPQMLTSYVKKN